MPSAVRWAPEFFDRPTIQDAKSAILSDEAGLTIEQRWIRETDWLMSQVSFPTTGTIVDFGCGVGRLSKPLAERYEVFGVDASPRMVEMAPEYVNNKNFHAVTTQEFTKMVGDGWRASGIISVWVMQHIQALDSTIELLHSALLPDSVFWLGDQAWRCYPAADADGKHYWAQLDDRKVVDSMLGPFWLTSLQAFPRNLCDGVATLSRWVRP